MSMPSDREPEAHQGRYSDGRSAAATVVSVRLGAQGMEIRGQGGGEPLTWPYDALGTATPLGGAERDVLVTCTQQKGATLFVDDDTFATELAAAVPQLTTRATRQRHATPWILACLAVLAVAGIIWVMDVPLMRTAAQFLPDSARMALGQQVVTSMTAGRKVCETPAGRAALDKLVQRLSAAAQGGKPFKVIVIDWALVNAFAAPGEQIVLTSGLIAKAGGPDEVAGVLAHEIGHGLELHPEAGVLRAIGLSAAIELMAGGNAGTLGNLGVLLAQFSYTRAAEREADAHALRILKAAAISPQGIVDFFAKVDKSEGAATGQMNILSTHPQTAERRKTAEAAPRYASTPALPDADWRTLRGICSSR